VHGKQAALSYLASQQGLLNSWDLSHSALSLLKLSTIPGGRGGLRVSPPRMLNTRYFWHGCTLLCYCFIPLMIWGKRWSYYGVACQTVVLG